MKKHLMHGPKDRVVHAADRAERRYGISPHALDYDDIRKQIVQGKSLLVDDQVLKQVHKVSLRGKPALCVYNVIKRQVVTFLPTDCQQYKQAFGEKP